MPHARKQRDAISGTSRPPRGTPRIGAFSEEVASLLLSIVRFLKVARGFYQYAQLRVCPRPVYSSQLTPGIGRCR